MRRMGMFMLMLCLPGLARAQVHALPSAPHILVKGHAQGDYVPDRFTIHLSIDVIDKIPDQARRKVEAHIEHILAALKKTGALKKYTRASSLQITPDYEFKDQHRVFMGTEVARGVQATFGSLQNFQNFIAKVKTDKEVQIESTEVGRSDIDRIRQKLREKAIANSREAARHIAEAYGLRIKGIYSVSEVAPDFAYGIQAGAWGGNSVAGELGLLHSPPKMSPPPPPPPPPPAPPHLQAGTISVQMNMYAVYLIESATTSNP